MHRVFISYSSKDQAAANRIVQALELAGLPCWIAARQIAGGRDYRREIVSALCAAEAVVLVFSANANNSPDVEREMSLVNEENKILFPARLEDVAPSNKLRYSMTNCQRVDLFPDFDRGLEQLCRHISAALDFQPPADTNLRQTTTRPWRRIGMLAIAVASSVVLVAILYHSPAPMPPIDATFPPSVDLPVNFVRFAASFSVFRDSAAYVAPRLDSPKMSSLHAGKVVKSAMRSQDGAWIATITADGQAAYIQMSDLSPYYGHVTNHPLPAPAVGFYYCDNPPGFYPGTASCTTAWRITVEPLPPNKR